VRFAQTAVRVTGALLPLLERSANPVIVDVSKTVEEGVQVILDLVKLDRSGPTGSFRDAAGVVPW
jgi:hypothetical protein